MLAWLKKHNVTTMLFALLLAVVIWYVVMGVINPDIEMTFSDIKVTIVGQTELYNRLEYSILSGTEFTMDVSLRGKRNIMLNWKKSDIELVADVSTISSSGEVRVPCAVNLPDSSVSVTNSSDLRITLLVDKMTTKEIPVVPEMHGSLDESLRLGQVTVLQDSVTVRGSASALASISRAVVRIPLAELSYTVTNQYPMTVMDNRNQPVQSEYVQLLTSTVEVHLPIQMIRTVPVRGSLSYGGGLTPAQADLSVSPEMITIIGERTKVEELDYISIAPISLSGIIDTHRANYPLELPEGVTCPSGRTSVEASVSVKNLTEKRLELHNIMVQGAAEGYSVFLLDRPVSVRIRGNADLLRTVNENNFSVVLDLNQSELTVEGEQPLPVAVTCLLRVNIELLEDDYVATVSVSKHDQAPLEPVSGE